MNNTTIMVWIAAMLLILTSCGKDASMGPQGPQGEQGIRGEKGEDGTTIYSGTVVPPANVGNVGDFYFRTGTSDFYGPKTADGWGTPINLRGATGATGAPGSKILSGTALPAADLGDVGDFYLRTSNAHLYGPKLSKGGWGNPTNLRGPAGPQGPAGTANVIYSYWFRFSEASWSDATISSFGAVKQVRFYTPHVTTDIVDKGVVLAYMRGSSSSAYYQLPYRDPNNFYVGFYPVGGTTNAIYFYSKYIGGDAVAVNPNNQFRFVIIPGGISANASLRNIDVNNYEAVKGALGLPD